MSLLQKTSPCKGGRWGRQGAAAVGARCRAHGGQGSGAVRSQWKPTQEAGARGRRVPQRLGKTGAARRHNVCCRGLLNAVLGQCAGGSSRGWPAGASGGRPAPPQSPGATRTGPPPAAVPAPCYWRGRRASGQRVACRRPRQAATAARNAQPRLFCPEVHGKVPSDFPVWCHVAIAKAIHQLTSIYLLHVGSSSLAEF
jgi:hypothetical protein